MKRRDALVVGGALLLGAGIAFPLGLMLGGHRSEPPPARSEATGMGRQMFSPKVLTDPDFRERQQQNVEALERACRERRQMCAEAAAARQWLERQRG